MSKDEEFQPRLGRARAKGRAKARTYLSRVLAAANLARGGAALTGQRRRFDGSRIGRGSGVGRVLAARDRYAAFRARRVIVKSRIVKLAGKGVAGARAHLRYIVRDGTTRDGARGQLYDQESEGIDGKTWLDRATGDRHQFRFIVSPEDGAQYDDLQHLTRRLMARMEEDLGTKLDWVAVDHFNTGHPHSHILVRGKDDRGKDLIIAREYITQGMRERACELVDLDLGPRTIQAVQDNLMGQVEQERLTSIDRTLLRETSTQRLVSAAAGDAFDQSLRMGRLRKLERLGLASNLGGTSWRLAPNLAETLTRMGERGDIIRTMQRAFTAGGNVPALADQSIYNPASLNARPLIGRVIDRGLSDELNDRHYLLVEATDGRSHYIDICRADTFEAAGIGAIVRVAPVPAGAREVDRTIAEVAAANGGRYTVDRHLLHDASASEPFAQAHVRRLEAIRRLTGGVSREPDGTWIVAPDHLDRAAAFEASRAKDHPVDVEALSIQPLHKLVDAEAATWLDRELVAAEPTPLRDAGFGRDAEEAMTRRRQWLIAQGFAEEASGRTIYSADMIAALQRRELARIGSQLSQISGKAFAMASPGARVSGIYRRSVDGVSGRYAFIERSRDFTLVPWRPDLDRHLGKTVSGILRGDGISWNIGRARSGPSIA